MLQLVVIKQSVLVQMLLPLRRPQQQMALILTIGRLTQIFHHQVGRTFHQTALQQLIMKEYLRRMLNTSESQQAP